MGTGASTGRMRLKFMENAHPQIARIIIYLAIEVARHERETRRWNGQLKKKIKARRNLSKVLCIFGSDRRFGTQPR